MTRERLVVQRPGNFRCAPVRGVTDGGQPPVSVVFAAGRRGVSASLDVLAAVGRCRGGVIFLFIPGKAGALRAGRTTAPHTAAAEQEALPPESRVSCAPALRAARKASLPGWSCVPGCLLPSEHFQFETLCASKPAACRFVEKTLFFSLGSGLAALCRVSPFTFFKGETLWPDHTGRAGTAAPVHCFGGVADACGDPLTRASFFLCPAAQRRGMDICP